MDYNKAKNLKKIILTAINKSIERGQFNSNYFEVNEFDSIVNYFDSHFTEKEE